MGELLWEVLCGNFIMNICEELYGIFMRNDYGVVFMGLFTGNFVVMVFWIYPEWFQKRISLS
jgi:hypothetical protein